MKTWESCKEQVEHIDADEATIIHEAEELAEILAVMIQAYKVSHQ